MESEKTKSWIYKCLAEKNPSFPTKNLSPEDIEDWTQDFILDLRSVFKHFVSAFDDLKQTGAKAFVPPGSEDVQNKLKGSLLIYDLKGNTGFMLFRKGYRLIFSYVKPGRIKVEFLKQKPLSGEEILESHFINAVVRNSLSVNWVHENHQGFVDIQVLARYYMKRFLQSI